MGTGAVFLRVKQLECEDYLLPSIARVRLIGAVSPLPLYAFMMCVGRTLPLPLTDRGVYEHVFGI
jgi:hypothetical protein